MATTQNYPVPEVDTLCKGFDILALAATFIAAIQGQVMSAMMGPSSAEDAIAIRAINAFFFGGLILDIMSASLAFLTARWLQRLSDVEKGILQGVLSQKNARRSPSPGPPQKSIIRRFFIAWLSLSLFVPMPLLVIGVVCMLAGIYTHLWTQHVTAVAALATAAGGATLPFLLGDFIIGRDENRRKDILHRLGEIQGDW